MRLQMSKKNLDKKRWIALAASVLLMSTLGIGYVWSLMVEPMITLRGATEENMATVYTALTLTGALLTILGGKMVDKIGSSKVIFSAIIAFALGHIICAVTDGFGGFAFAEITLLAWQQAVVYIAVYTNIIKMFPDWKGLAIAISCTGISIGGAYLPVLVQRFIDTIGFDNMFWGIAAVETIVGIIGIVLFPDAADNYCPEGYEEPDYDNAEEYAENGTFVQKDWKGMLKDPAFYMIFLIPILGTTTYMLLSYQLAWIAQDVLTITASQSAFLVSGVSIIGVVAGVVGPIADKTGRLLAALLCFGLGTISIAGLIAAGSHGVGWFTVCTFVYCFCFGGFATIHPVIVSDLFGSKNFGFNYSICYQATLIAAALSPWLGVLGGTDEGDYTLTFTICTVMCAAGFVLMLVLWLMRRNKIEPQIKRVKTKEEA